MAKPTLMKFRHDDHKGIFHYVVYKDDFVALSEITTGKIDYIKQHGAIDITFDIKEENYDILGVDVITDEAYVKEVYDFMLETDNTYFKSGIAGLCVLRFHK